MKVHGHSTKALTGQDKANQAPSTRDELGKAKLDQATPQAKAAKGFDQSNLTVSRMRDRIQAEPDVNVEKVKALKAMIKKGEYNVDTAKLANKMLKESALEDT